MKIEEWKSLGDKERSRRLSEYSNSPEAHQDLADAVEREFLIEYGSTDNLYAVRCTLGLEKNGTLTLTKLGHRTNSSLPSDYLGFSVELDLIQRTGYQITFRTLEYLFRVCSQKDLSDLFGEPIHSDMPSLFQTIKKDEELSVDATIDTCHMHDNPTANQARVDNSVRASLRATS